MSHAVEIEGVQDMRGRIRSAAVDLFAAKGFHGTSVRDLAHAVGVEAASLYYHFPSKQDLLFDLFERIMDDLLELLHAALAAAGSPSDRLRAVVHSHVLYHITRRKEAFVSHSELRSLTPANLKRIVLKRDRYESAIRALLDAGVVAGEFNVPDLPVAANALLSMCSSVADWIKPRGRLQAEQMADLYGALAMRLVGARDHVAPARAPSARR